MQVPDNAPGKQVRCPGCSRLFQVGSVGSAPAREPVAAGAAAGAARPAASPTPPSPTPAAKPSGPVAVKPAPPTACPACGSALLPGAIACMDCGFLLQAEAGAEEGAPHLCINPACGVANPPGERYCQRCSNPLPISPGSMMHNRYRIEKLLAMGGFGAVYLATDTKAGNRPVALKDMICADKQEFSIRMNFFRREAEILRSLESLPVVPRVYDLIEQGDSAQLVLEFIRGKDLLKILEEDRGNKPFTADLAVEWGKSVCDVLTHMHSQSPPIVHRDLKPDNLMLLEDGRTIKMIDFGTARDLGRSQQERKAAKTRVYTEGYAPPEQIIGKPEPRSDLFALAGTLYHLVTGKSPEGSFTARELEEQMKGPNPPFPAEQRWLFELIKINLSEDAKDRYFSAREVKADLERRRVTTEVSCPKCRQVNKVREPYCSRCAEPLTDPAPPCQNCGKLCALGSRFCIHCGSPMR
jgi:predicted Ser/Thr protein kinase